MGYYFYARPLQNDVIRDRLFDGTFNLIENHRSD